MGQNNLKSNTIDELITKINGIVGDNFQLLDEQTDIKKWNRVPKLLLLNEEQKSKILSFVDFIDSLLIPIEEKIIYVISLSGLLEYGKINLDDYDEGSLVTMADYYKNSSIEHIINTIAIMGNKGMLLAIRTKTLDQQEREKLLLDVANRIISDRIDITNGEQVTNFINLIIQELNK